MLECGNRSRELVLVVPGPAEKVPRIGVFGPLRHHFREPLLGIAVIAQHHVIGSDNLEFIGARPAKFRAGSEFSQRFFCFLLAKQRIAEEEMRISALGICAEVGVENGF